MKKLLGILCLTIAAGGTVIALRNNANAMQIALPLVKVECHGNNGCCQDTGARNFIYDVKVPGGNVVSVSSITVGTHDSTLADYTNLLMPTGWSLSIISNTPLDAHVCTPHGTVSMNTSRCPYALFFSGPAQTANFTLGYDFALNWDHHDTNWKASNGNGANWAKPVGLGEGPVHSPWMQ